MEGVADLKIKGHALSAEQENFFGSPGLSIFSLQYDLDSQIVTGQKDGSVRVYNSKNPAKVNYYTTARGQALPTVSVRWLPKQKRHFLSLNAGGIILLCDELLHDLTYFKTHEEETLAMDVNPSGAEFTISTKQNRVAIFDISTGKQSRCLKAGVVSNNYEGHSNHVYAIKHINEAQVLTGGWDSTVRLWDLRACRQQALIHGPNISGEGLDFKDGMVLTGSYRNEEQLQLWDLGTQKNMATFTWDPEDPKKAAYVYSCRFGEGKLAGYVLGGADKSNDVKVFDRNSQACELTICGHAGVHSLDVRGNGFCFGGDSGIGHIIKVN